MTRKTTTPLNEVTILSRAAKIDDLPKLIKMCLPKQGCIEVQNDQDGKEHAWHTNETDKTIVVLEGALCFYWAGRHTICTAGDVIQFPKLTLHASLALQAGAKYIITFAEVEFPQ
ncbi:cupin domain-containing protein [Pseudovibrio sp. Tun.PSC04-5.I4]|uniref:cupin domain-containing protein n=1 Tax=Pseudovibrio sp. Tun.PSC04-5.I4 TaxID=1798213 RepID=UPI00088C7AC9|nr:cupin domain-containing protein [Pseudovibrio sp. Tun.PSC04-5.I4]SDQ19966.1 Cupin domain-containing protein [Pseudovibrio sp. Tun.PSC04-5.I4]